MHFKFLFFKVLDKMVLYLRIVHSVDFYNHSEYPNEDEMPNRSDLLKGYIYVISGKVVWPWGE